MMIKLQLIFSKLFPLCLVLCGLNVAAVQAQSDITIDFGDEISGEPGDQVTITVNTSDLTGLDVPNFDFEFSFDSNLIQFNNEDITAGELLSANLVPNVTDDNRILIGYANSAPIAGSGTLLTLTGTLVSEGKNSEGFSVTDYFFGDGSLSVSPALPHHVPVSVEVVDPETIELDFGGKINAGPGESISIPVSTSDLTGLEISNFDFEFQFDSGLLSFETEDILPGLLVSNISGNVTSDDRILVSYANSVPIESEGLLFTINGTAESAGQNGNGFVVSDVLMGDGSADIFPTIPHSITVEVIANQPPTVTIVNGPADGSTIDFSDPGFAWSGSDTDGTVEGYEVDLQGPSPTGFSTTETTHQFNDLADGDYTFRVRAADNNGAYSAWAERSFTIDTSPEPAPDLIVSDLSISPSSPKEGDTVTFTFSILNQGNENAGAFDWQLSVDGSVVENAGIGSLDAGATTTKTREITNVAAGSYTVEVIADINNDVNESDETNNEASASYDVEGSPLLSVTPTSRNVGSSAGSTTFQVTNDGGGTLQWSASATAGWFSITSGNSGSGSGTIEISYQENTGSHRTGTLEITSSNAGNSPVEVTISQNGTDDDPPIANYTQGWNLVSIPEEISGQSLEEYFSTITANTDIYEFDGQYVEMQSLASGKGYWLKLDANEEVEFTGEILGSLTLSMETGWNLVGTIGDTLSVPGDIQDPNGIIKNGAVWALDHDEASGQYELVETNEVLPGKGYFIKANSAGEVTLSNQ